MINTHNNTWSVYIHISPSNKYYIGITGRNVNERWKNGYGYSANKYFENAIKKYGWDNFQHEIIANNITKREACNLEILLIEKLNATDRKCGYNCSSGGEFGYSCSGKSEKEMNEIRKKLSDAFYNKTDEELEEWKFKQREAHRKPVVLKNTGEVFLSVNDASIKYNTFQGHIGRCCNNKRKSAGKDIKGNPLIWEWHIE